eukprot:TRINITY_DN5567_c0_g3_i2.p1 TRINITY_DN5567_c0_g3~~TRINITY_DN5567_c0_g3_i2.p1  ORF type:complete len:854 (-),score=129.71 TRINITY_DN5567_c0_g3_i2:82-2265(-)
MSWQSTGSSAMKDRMTYLVTELGKCQQKMGTGYLSAFPTSWFDRLEAYQPVWAPYYTIHKIMAGLIDQYQRAGNNQALQIVIGMAKYFGNRIDNVIKTQGMSGWQRILDVEWGGMNEALYTLYEITGDPEYLKTANYFDHFSFTRPLAAGVDALAGLHANTHIPEVIGSQRGYEVTGNITFNKIANFFFDTIKNTRSYATAGNNDYEYWTTPHSLGDTTNGNSEESCTQYNMQKVARHLFEWTANVEYADFYERAMWGGIIGNMHHRDFGKYIYYMPLAGGFVKGWGDPYNSFWCCYGTMIESHAKLGDSIYFTSTDSNDLFINQFVSSTVRWVHATITQDAGFPNSTTYTTRITINDVKNPNAWKLQLRIPEWATSPQNSIKLNGKSIPGPFRPSSYLLVDSVWTSGDTLEVYFPMSLSIMRLDDNRKRFQNTYAISYGPIVLAGIYDSISESFQNQLIGDLNSPDSWIHRTSATELEFTANDQRGSSVKLIPLAYVVDEPYVVYFDANPPPTLKSIQSVLTQNGQPLYLRHSGPDFYNNWIYSSPVSSSQENEATWIIFEGLVQEKENVVASELISFEPYNFDQGFYIIHNGPSNTPATNWTLQTATAGPAPWPQYFQEAASFWVRPGLSDSSKVSFESYDHPGYYISTYNQIDPCTPSQCRTLCGYSTCTAVYLRKLVQTSEFFQSSTFIFTNPVTSSSSKQIVNRQFDQPQKYGGGFRKLTNN